MVEDALRWPTMGGTYLEVLDCLGTALVDLLGGITDFSNVDAFGMFLETGLTLVLVNVKGSGGAQTLREPIDPNRSFPAISTFSIVLAALKTLRHMLDFRSIASCLGFGQQTCGWAIWITKFATNLVSCSAVCLLFWAVGECFGLQLRHTFFGC